MVETGFAAPATLGRRRAVPATPVRTRAVPARPVRTRALPATRTSSAWALIFAFALIITMPAEVAAHRPLFAGMAAAEPEAAVRINDPTASHVLYAELTASAPYRWFAFDMERPASIKFQLGTPVGSGWESTSPALALLGPGLSGAPDAALNVPALSERDGMAVLSRSDEERFFDEPVTGTTSWILMDRELTLPEPGTYYGVVFDRSGQGGKYWVGIGERESFTWRDVLRLPGWVQAVRRFHEVPGWPLWMWIAAAVLVAGVIALGWGVGRLLGEYS